MTGDLADGNGIEAQRRALLFALGRVAGGDRRALEEVYRRTAAKLFAVCLRILPERADAEEALQETYVAVWRNAASFDPDKASPVAWLAAIARNRAIDRLRARGNRVVLPVEAAADVPDPSPGAVEGIEATEDEARVAACLAGLAPDEAGLIRDAFYGGASYPELAVRASLPLGTVKSRVRRALLKLRACLS
ncbi:sigma-70 family RNA polymerase sigma factor [Methylobacterium oryzisoli]|uniref:sigma-70 family RNA polymerase sigma factor n=1 Tax=Methylobacterium oryzisoli TaxID=3385502 RepID=UPI0038915148